MRILKRVIRILPLLLLCNSINAMDADTQSKELLRAAQLGDATRCSLLITSGANVNYADDEGRTALEFAAERRYKDVTEVLIQAGANVNHKNKYDNNALTNATILGDNAIALLLIQAGIDINYVPRDKQTVLKSAAMNGHQSLVKLFIAHGADVNLGSNQSTSALFWAACNGHDAIVQLLIKAGAEVNSKDSTDTALRAAAMCGHTDIVKQLLAAGAHVDLPWVIDGLTALSWAAINAHTEVAQLLIEAGADPYHITCKGETALLIASQRPDSTLPICTLLVQKMLVATHKKRLLTFLWALKQNNTTLYCPEMRHAIGRFLKIALQEENRQITRKEINKIEHDKLKNKLLLLLN